MKSMKDIAHELALKELRVRYWEKYHRLPDGFAKFVIDHRAIGMMSP